MSQIFLHLLVTSAQAMLLALLTLWFFRLRSRFGLSFFVAASVMLGAIDLPMNQLITSAHSELFWHFGGSLLFSCKLFAVLLLYVREDATEARAQLYGVLMGAIAALMISVLSGLHVLIGHGSMEPYSDLLRQALLIVFGMAILVADAILLILVYEWLASRIKSSFVCAFIALAVALSFDNIVYQAIFAKNDNFGFILLISFLGKWYAALLYAGAFALGLRFHGIDPGSKLRRDVQDVFQTLTFRQRFEALKRSADMDPLTGAFNRARLEVDAAQKLQNDRCTLALIDVDHFKSINDTRGHAFGDLVLQEIVRRIQNLLPFDAAIYRYGGEEFVVLGELEHAMLEQIRLSIAQTQIAERSVTVSIGAAMSAESNGLRAIFDLADKRLYQAKAAGRNRLVFNEALRQLQTQS
jgi:diguanylate cyclase (GGDEF)-like protein